MARPRLRLDRGALVALVAALALVLVITLVGIELRTNRAGAGSLAPPPTTTTTVPNVAPTTTTTAAGPPSRLRQPMPVTLPPIADGVSYGLGTENADLTAYEQRLADLRFDPGPVDGSYDLRTLYAVEGLQKLTGLDPNGRIGVAEEAALEQFRYPEPLHPDAEANRTEIDVTKQVLTLYEGGEVRLVSPTSTGSGEAYCYDTPLLDPTEHVCELATTPSGRFTYYSFHKGWHEGVLGALYNPFYFNGGIAVHGYSSVPTHPASHGCARIPMDIAEYFYTLVHQGDPVYVDGGSPAKVLSRTPIEPSTSVPDPATSTTTPTGTTTSSTPPTTSTTTSPPTTTTT